MFNKSHHSIILNLYLSFFAGFRQNPLVFPFTQVKLKLKKLDLFYFGFFIYFYLEITKHGLTNNT